MDHRIAMSAASPITSFPDFIPMMRSLGAEFS
jgi:5-enolpyruvylshikimate-3-phosphate synthase